MMKSIKIIICFILITITSIYACYAISPDKPELPDNNTLITEPSTWQPDDTFEPIPGVSNPIPEESTTLPHIPPHQHKYTIVYQEPSCTQEGFYAHCCPCGYTETTAITQIEHSYDNVSREEATCTSPGKITYSCNCGAAMMEDIAQLEHTYKTTKTIESTITTAGYQVYACTQCNSSYIETLPLKTTALDREMCGDSLWMKPLPHSGYTQFALAIFESIKNRTTYTDVANGAVINIPDDMTFQELRTWFDNAYRYVSYPFAYTVYRNQDGSMRDFRIWGKETDYATMDAVSIECQRILQELNINSYTTQKEAIIRINRYLCENSYYEYDESKRDGYPYASIMNEGKVCHNYALAFQMLCLHAGIECEYYASNTINHAWNKVYCSDGTYYWVDVCWNDGNDITKYLLLTTEQLLKTHSL